MDVRSQDTKRIFLALPLGHLFTGDVEQFLLSTSSKIQGIKWVEPSFVHVTLHFFGSVPVSEIPVIRETAVFCAGNHAPMNFFLEGLGFFPSQFKPRVLWAALKGGIEGLLALQKELTDGLAAKGFAIEERAFSPHVTLGRIKRPGECRLAPDIDFPKTAARQADHFVLYESRLSSQGPCYEILETFPFNRR